LGISLALTLAIMYIPPFAAVFSLVPLRAGELAVSLSLAVSVIPVIELVKFAQRKVKEKAGPVRTFFFH